jgi:hypothetical protein
MAEKPRHPESVVKCSCGKVMRLKNRQEHCKICHRSVAPLEAKDIDRLLAEEAQAKKEEAK